MQQPSLSSSRFTTDAAYDGTDEDSSSDPSVNENWTSPAELLEMRTMWSAILSQNKAEMKALKTALERSEHKNEAYTRELMETANLRRLYSNAKVEHQNMQKAQQAWIEERLSLYQQIERYKLLEQQVINRQGSTGTDTTTSGWSGPTTQSSTFTNTQTKIIQEENIALHEAITRKEFEKKELESRLHVTQALSERDRRAQQSVNAIQGTTMEILQKKFASTQDSLMVAQASKLRLEEERFSLQVEVEKAQQQILALRGELERQKEHLVDQSARSIEDINRKNGTLVDELRRLIGAQASEIEDLRASIERATDEIQKRMICAISEHRDELQQVEDELSECRRARDEALNRAEILERSSQQLVEEIKIQLAEETNHKNELFYSNHSLADRLHRVTQELSVTRLERENLNSELSFLRHELDTTKANIEAIQADYLEAIAYKERAITLEGLVISQQTFYEKHLKEHVTAMDLMQNKHSEDTKTLLAIVAENKKDIITEPVKVVKKKRECKKKHHNLSQDILSPKKSSNEKECMEPVISKLDSVALMIKNCIIASDCARTISK
eukprot:Tbor_TRINITY_DN3572_c0_g1::TRINITY_DN3572_c0_g1_i1::g.2916::m.2916